MLSCSILSKKSNRDAQLKLSSPKDTLGENQIAKIAFSQPDSFVNNARLKPFSSSRELKALS